MNGKFHQRFLMYFLILALALTSCAAPSTATVGPAETAGAAPQEAASPTLAATATETPPVRLPPPPLLGAAQEEEVTDDGAPLVATEAAPPPAPTAAPQTVASDVTACRLPHYVTTNVFDYALLGIPRSPGFTPSTGTVKVTVLFADYSDAPAAMTPDQALALLPAGATSAYFKEVSYGRVDVVFEPYLAWLRLSQPSAAYREKIDANVPENERTLLEEAVALAGANVNFADTDLVLLIANPDANGINPDFAYPFTTSDTAQGIKAGSVSITSGLILGAILKNPEAVEPFRNDYLSRIIGNTMTLMRHGYRDTTLYPNLTSDQRRSATGSFSVMNTNADVANAHGMFAYERWHLGWLDDAQIFCQTSGDQTTQLTAIEQTGGTAAVMVPLGGTAALMVESRRAIGVDQALVKPGALVYKVDTSKWDNQAPIEVLPLPPAESDLMRDQAPLAQGESLTYCNITVTNVTAGPAGDNVRVTINGPLNCPEAAASGAAPTQAAVVATAAPTQVAAAATATPAQLAAGSPTNADGCAGIPDPVQGDATIRFINTSGYQSVVYWVDTSQSPPKEVQYVTLKNKARIHQESMKGYKWVVRDQASGAVLLEYTASGDKRQCAMIKAPLGALWLEFDNQSGVDAVGYLMDANGQLKQTFRLGVGANTGLWTAQGNSWRIADRNGNLLLDYTSTGAANQRVVIPPLTGTPTPLVIATATAAATPMPTATPLPTPTPLPTVAMNPATNCPTIPGEQVVCYNVTGATEFELVSSLMAQSPVLPDYSRWDWNIDLGVNFSDPACNLANVTTTLDQVILLPSWTPPANADPALVARWNSFIQASTLWTKTAAETVRANRLSLENAAKSATCATADAAVQAAAASLNAQAIAAADAVVQKPVFP